VKYLNSISNIARYVQRFPVNGRINYDAPR